MKIVKILENRSDNFNRAIIEKYFDNGATICTVQQVEAEVDTNGNPKLDEDGKVIEKIIKQDTNIGFEAGSFKFTSEELDYFLPPSNVDIDINSIVL